MRCDPRGGTRSVYDEGVRRSFIYALPKKIHFCLEILDQKKYLASKFPTQKDDGKT